jgi:hypothetical protein
MKWRGLIVVLTLGAVIPLGAPLASAGSPSVSFASGPTYATAKRVCLSASFPTGCPSGAYPYNYGSPATEWRANLSVIPGAWWIWRADTNRAAIGDLATFTTSKTVNVPGTPLRGTLYIAVDDFARVRVNGTVAGTWGSTSDPVAASFANNNTTSFNITSLLHSGTNTIVVEAQNGPSSFPPACGPCTYQQNPAGVVFGGNVSYQP